MESMELFEQTIKNLSNTIAQQAQEIATLQAFIQCLTVNNEEAQVADESSEDAPITAE